ncbi:DNA/RNA non-specific endonuclease [Thermophilibacter mediterraneus]|uniref:DNA/RNA non-specific endonuclease n=1 Tax=Thermophilibacter mediterraneus TaxID=1871031 RepID=UPI000932022A|nr:DNA/RNA non-specific endonuclease [Thermophilibacter mediterraneus]
MALENREGIESPLDKMGAAIDSAKQTVTECANNTWNEITSNDAISMSIKAMQDIADDAWSTCSPLLEQAGDIATKGAKNVAYISGRVGLGAADLVEDAYIGIRSNIEFVTTGEDAAVESAQTGLIDNAVDAWNDYMQVDDQVRDIGDMAQTTGRFAAEAAVGTAAVITSTPLAVASGAALVASEMGKTLEANTEDGEISTGDIVEQIAAGGLTAATLAGGRLLSNSLLPKGGAKELGKAGQLVDDAGNIIDDVDSLAPRKSYFVDGTKCSTDDLGKVYRVGDDLVPDTTYEINGYRYTTDSKGRITSAEGTLRLKAHDDRLSIRDTLEKIGKGFQQAFDERGHLIGDRFDGSAGMENIIAMNGTVNRGAYANIERKCADALKQGKDVFYRVEPVYDGSSHRPTAFAVTDIIDGEETVTFLRNIAKG